MNAKNYNALGSNHLIKHLFIIISKILAFMRTEMILGLTEDYHPTLRKAMYLKEPVIPARSSVSVSQTLIFRPLPLIVTKFYYLC